MSKFTVFPKRQLILAIEHPTIGDARFCPEVQEAILQLSTDKNAIYDADSFTADNGITIDLINIPMLLPEEVGEGNDPGGKADLPKIEAEMPDDPLKTALQTVIDTEDSLDAIQQAIQDADYSSALTLINSSRESLQEHIETLRGLL